MGLFDDIRKSLEEALGTQGGAPVPAPARPRQEQSGPPEDANDRRPEHLGHLSRQDDAERDHLQRQDLRDHQAPHPRPSRVPAPTAELLPVAPTWTTMHQQKGPDPVVTDRGQAHMALRSRLQDPVLLRETILLAEILGSPVSKRPRRRWTGRM